MTHGAWTSLQTGGLTYKLNVQPSLEKKEKKEHVLPAPGKHFPSHACQNQCKQRVKVACPGSELSAWQQLTRLVPIDDPDRAALCSVGVAPAADQQAATELGLVTGHAYSLLGVKACGGGGPDLLRLRNPWGSKEWSGAFSDGDAKWTDEIRAQLPPATLVNREDGAFWCAHGCSVICRPSRFLCDGHGVLSIRRLDWPEFASFFHDVGVCNPFLLLPDAQLRAAQVRKASPPLPSSRSLASTFGL